MKHSKKKIAITVEKTTTGYSAFADQEDVFSTGKTIPELYQNLIEALNLAYEDNGVEITRDNLKLRLDLKQFFQYYRVLNATFLAEHIGMNPTLLSQYVRGKKTPSEKQTDKILSGIQSIGRELSELSFT
ncbi:MAG: type II toxin-antitoxin system HicB family antitoxin [Crocinitomicaceae bacterium]